MKSIIGAILFLFTSLGHAQSDGVVHIWPTIPFIRGADLCAYQQAYSQTRSEYMREMSGLAQDLMQSGAYGSEALDLLITFDALYAKNVALATRYQYLDVTLENTLKGYVDQYYRDLNPRTKKMTFSHINRIQDIVAAARNGQRIGHLPENTFEYLDFVAYGSYAFAPDCKGNIQVTVTLVGRRGETETFLGNGKPSVVMSQIASKMFERFQRTRFPTTLRLGQRQLTLIGGLNGSVDTVQSLEMARMACESQDDRLPTPTELDLISAYGDWNGGVGVGHSVWVVEPVRGGSLKVFHPDLRNPSPVREQWEVNDRTFYYYCVK